MSTIFISLSSHENAWAERICDWLKDEQKQRPQVQRFRSLFLDFDPDADIQTGERRRDQLYEHLQLCAAVIVICSEAYAASQWCLAELGVAMPSGKLALPVRIAAGTPLPRLLEQFRPEEAEDPTPALAAVLRQACRALDLPPPDEDATTAEALHRQLRQLRLQSNQQDARVVVPIDQFEEVLGRGNERNPKAASAADAFLALLAELLAMKASQVLIIATLRCLAGMGDKAGAIRNLWPSERRRAAQGRCGDHADPACPFG